MSLASHCKNIYLLSVGDHLQSNTSYLDYKRKHFLLGYEMFLTACLRQSSSYRFPAGHFAPNAKEYVMNIRNKFEEAVAKDSQDLSADALEQLIEVQLDKVVGGVALGYKEVSGGTYNRG
jgi:hypothetical protein